VPLVLAMIRDGLIALAFDCQGQLALERVTGCVMDNGLRFCRRLALGAVAVRKKLRPRIRI